MLKCLLNFLLIATVSLAAQDLAFLPNLGTFYQPGINGDRFGNFHPAPQQTIPENELRSLEKSLDRLDDERADANNNFVYVEDETQKDFNDGAGFQIKSEMKKLELPSQSGSPAFTVNAQKVYILYPSIFQDPNVYGRFSIPQNINLDPNSEQITKVSLKTDQPMNNNPAPPVNGPPRNPPPVNIPPNNRRFADPSQNDPSSFMLRRFINDRQKNHISPGQDGGQGMGISKRQAPLPPRPSENAERNVETHLSGSVVVLNQDVNENNRKDAY